MTWITHCSQFHYSKTLHALTSDARTLGFHPGCWPDQIDVNIPGKPARVFEKTEGPSHDAYATYSETAGERRTLLVFN